MTNVCSQRLAAAYKPPQACPVVGPVTLAGAAAAGACHAGHRSCDAADTYTHHLSGCTSGRSCTRFSWNSLGLPAAAFASSSTRARSGSVTATSAPVSGSWRPVVAAEAQENSTTAAINPSKQRAVALLSMPAAARSLVACAAPRLIKMLMIDTCQVVEVAASTVRFFPGCDTVQARRYTTTPFQGPCFRL